MSNDFLKIKAVVDGNFTLLSKQDTLFTVEVDKDEIWQTYQNAYPAEHNRIFRERPKHDCNCCKNFIRRVGSVVAIDGQTGAIHTVWGNGADSLPHPYNIVAKTMDEYIKSRPIMNTFITSERVAGAVSGPDTLDKQIIWDHFHAIIPNKFIPSGSLGADLGASLSRYSTLKSSLEVITTESVQLVLDLIRDNNLYRGQDNQHALATFLGVKGRVDSAINREFALWIESAKAPEYIWRMKNTSIGTLLVNISEGMEVEAAVNAYEKIVAGDSYKRPKALATPAMIRKAEKDLTEMGYIDSLERRHAKETDIKVNNTLFVDRSITKKLSVFDDMAESHTNAGDLGKSAKPISVDKFVEDVLPTAATIDVLFDNKASSKLMTLVAPAVADSKNMLKWDNNFSWSYKGEIADSIDERVKTGGGSTDGFLRASLIWDGKDDLDLSVVTPQSEHIYFGHRSSICGGKLDVDANGGDGYMANPVENIVWSKPPKPGNYQVKVHNYSRRTGNDGFTIKLKFGDQEYFIQHNKRVNDGERIMVIEFNIDNNGELKILSSSDQVSGNTVQTEVWGLKTMTMVPVKMAMWSPNYWDGNATGNKQLFLILDGCQNPDQVRGFYNEFLKSELSEHRKVFEMLAGKTKVDYNPDQLSGIGFSTTKPAELIVRVNGSYSRMFKVQF